MASLLGVNCDLVNELDADESLKKQVHAYTAPGQTGLGLFVVATAESSLEFEAIRYSTGKATVTAWLAAIEAIQGSIGSIVDSKGDTRSNVVCVEVRALYGRPSLQYSSMISGIGAGWIGTLRIVGKFAS